MQQEHTIRKEGKNAVNDVRSFANNFRVSFTHTRLETFGFRWKGMEEHGDRATNNQPRNLILRCAGFDFRTIR